MINENILEEQMIEDINNNCSDTDPEAVEEIALGIVDEEVEEIEEIEDEEKEA